MLELSCPSCGAPLRFRTKTSLFVVCSYCSSYVIRNDREIELIGKMAQLPEDLSPIQIGTSGRYDRTHFYVAGRIIYSWVDGVWNEWYLIFDDYKIAWLGEAQGEFMITYPLEAGDLPSQSDLSLGQNFEVLGKNFKLKDIKEVSYLGSEGELPFKAESNYRSTVYDFSCDNLFLTIEYPESHEEPFAYYGKYVELEKLNLKNIRYLEGWV